MATKPTVPKARMGSPQNTRFVAHGPRRAPQQDALRLGFLLTLCILAVEVAASLAAHSLALLADAGHILTDVAALVTW